MQFIGIVIALKGQNISGLSCQTKVDIVISTGSVGGETYVRPPDN
jgi:hypothetical protein